MQAQRLMIAFFKTIMMNEFVIREAAIKDLGTLLEFEQELIEAERPFDPTLKREPTNYYDLNFMISAPHIHLVVAEKDGQLLASGYARIEPSEHFLQHTRYAYIGFMYVIPSFRGKGINQAIVNELEAWARQQSIMEMRLEVYYENETAIKAYAKVGFQKHMIEMRKGV